MLILMAIGLGESLTLAARVLMMSAGLIVVVWVAVDLVPSFLLRALGRGGSLTMATSTQIRFQATNPNEELEVAADTNFQRGTALGLTLIGVGALVGSSGVLLGQSLGIALRIALAGGLTVIGWSLLFRDRRTTLARRAEGRSVRSFDPAEGSDYAVFLRSFGDDSLWLPTTTTLRHSPIERIIPNRSEPLEDVILWPLWALLPVVALGDPRSSAPGTGGLRLSETDERWQTTIRRLLEGCSVVVVVLGSTPSLRWELQEVKRLALDRAIFLVPPVPRAERVKRVNELINTLNIPFTSADPAQVIAMLGHNGTLQTFETLRFEEFSYETATELLAIQVLFPDGIAT